MSSDRPSSPEPAEPAVAPRGLTRRRLLGAAGLTAAAVAFEAAGPASILSSAVAGTPQSRLGALADLRFGMFNHFNLGTFTNEEWAAPNQDPKLFAPTGVNCNQWAAAAAAAKMTFGVLTTKHHDGFALWPTKYGTQNVAFSSYKHDVVRQYVRAFRSRGLKVGLYFSIWDRTHPVSAYGGHVDDPTQEILPADLDYIEGQITELLTNYGKIDLFITDGYAWQAGQRRVPYQRIRNLVRSLQPDCVMVDHGGLSVPYLGDAIYFEEPVGNASPAGNTYASLQGQTISYGWFWHPWTPTDDPMSQDDIVGHLQDLEPKWTTFLLNCPPNRDGVLDYNIVQRLAGVGQAWSPNPSRAPLPAQPPRAEWPITPPAAYATGNHDGEGPMRAIDGFSDTNTEQCWSTWSPQNGSGPLALPQAITVDLGGVWSDVSTLEYLPKQWNRNNATDGDITSATISTSTDGTTWTTATTVSWASSKTPKVAQWKPRDVGFVRITVAAATGDYVNVSDLRIGGRTRKPALVRRTVDAATTYRLVNKASGLALTVPGSATTDGTALQQAPATGAEGQQWRFVDAGDGFQTLQDLGSGSFAEIAGLSRDPGAVVELHSAVAAFQQHWAVTPIDGGLALLTNRFSGLVMAGVAGSTDPGAGVEQTTYDGSARCQWQLVTV